MEANTKENKYPGAVKKLWEVFASALFQQSLYKGCSACIYLGNKIRLAAFKISLFIKKSGLSF